MDIVKSLSEIFCEISCVGEAEIWVATESRQIPEQCWNIDRIWTAGNFRLRREAAGQVWHGLVSETPTNWRRPKSWDEAIASGYKGFQSPEQGQVFCFPPDVPQLRLNHGAPYGHQLGRDWEAQDSLLAAFAG